MVLHYIGPWDGTCPKCGTDDMAVTRRTVHNEHWECLEGHQWFLEINESVRASKEARIRCFWDDIVAARAEIRSR